MLRGLGSGERVGRARPGASTRGAVVAALVATAGVACAWPGFGPGLPSRGRGHADTTWGTARADTRNSGYVPIEVPRALEQRWRALEGAAVFSAPSLAPDGTLYVTTGGGAGRCHLHALAPDGALRWESAPQRDVRDLDSLAVLSAPAIDASGTVYVADSDQLWAFRADGSVAWRVELAEHGVYGPFIGVIIRGSRVGGVSANGQLALFQRKTGERVVPVLALEAGSGPERGPSPGVWAGLMDPEIRTTVWKVLQGERYAVTRPPALHPLTGRIYVAATADRPEDAVVYGVDLRSRRLELAFATRVPSAWGASLLVSADGRRVVGAGAEGTLFALDATSGELFWSKRTGASSGVPAEAPDGTVFVPVDDGVLALDGARGRVLWRRSFDELVSSMLPELPRAGGRPTGLLGGAVTATRGALFTSVVAAYRLGDPPLLAALPVRGVLLALSPHDGTVSQHWLLPDSSDGSVVVAKDGSLYLGLLAAQTSLGFDWMRAGGVPPTLRVAEPQGGVVAFEPAPPNE